MKVACEEGFVVMISKIKPAGQKIEIATLKNVTMKEKTIQINFKSLFFSDLIEINKTDALNVFGRIDSNTD